MKRFFSLILILSLLLGSIAILAACDNGENETEKETVTETEESANETVESTQSGTETEKETNGSAAEATESDTEAPTESETATKTATETVTETVTETSTETESATESESTTEAPTETESETEEETTCYHPYDATQEGHWKPACDVCGKGTGRMQEHEYREYAQDEGDLIYYSYVCTICNFIAYAQEIPYEINLFYPASEIAKFGGAYKFDAGIGYASFSGSGTTSTVNVEESGSMEDDPIGQYVAIKLRMPRSQNVVTLNVQSVHADKSYSLKLNNLKSGWLTLVIDLSKIAKNVEGTGGTVSKVGYFANEYSEFYLKSFSVASYVGVGESLDIAYIAFCEEYEDILSFVEGENNYYVYKDALVAEPEKYVTECKHDYVIDTENGTHSLRNDCYICGTCAVSDEKHTIVEIKGNGKNSYECSVCEYAQYYKEVPVEVNKYYSASELNAGGIIYYPFSGFNHGMYVETGDAYTRYYGPTSLNGDGYFNVGQVIFARDDADFGAGNGDKENGIRIAVGDATYFVLRVRVNTEGLNPLKITISTTGHAGQNIRGNPIFAIPVASTPANTWNTYVINLAEVFPDKYLPEQNGNYVVDTFYFNICEGNFAPGCTLDLSYMAYCSSWDEVAALVDEEKLFYLTDEVGGGNWVDTETRSCESHTLGGTEIVEKDGKRIYQFLCSVCGQPAVTKTVESSVTRYYYPGEIAKSATMYFQINGAYMGQGGNIIYDQEIGLVHSRFTGYTDENPVSGQALWQRAQEDMWGGQTSTDDQHYTEKIGNAEWFVMRVKSSKSSQNILFTFSTTTYNTADAEKTGKMNGMIDVTIPVSASLENEWTTYVINLKDVAPEAFLKDDMGTPDDTSDDEYVIDSFYLTFQSFAQSETIDIEYMAFVEGSWAEIDALCDDETAVNLTDTKGTYKIVSTATGEVQ